MRGLSITQLGGDYPVPADTSASSASSATAARSDPNHGVLAAPSTDRRASTGASSRPGGVGACGPCGGWDSAGPDDAELADDD
jgi:hypothetical protein